MNNIKTVAYKGSKRKLLQKIEEYTMEVNPKTFFDAFSGTGIVSAHMRNAGLEVTANDLSNSSYLYGRVFLEGFDEDIVRAHVEKMNSLDLRPGWLHENYSGTRVRKVRGQDGLHTRPMLLTEANAAKLDAARDYVDSLTISERNKNALVFSTILALNKVSNNTNDQKSSLKKWAERSLKSVKFECPTLISGPAGKQVSGDVFTTKPNADVVYFDPPYTHGVLYPACYHLNDSMATWTKPELNHGYSLPRPQNICFRENKENLGGFYSHKEAPDAFHKIFSNTTAKRIITSYSYAPRNCIDIKTLYDIAKEYGKVSVQSMEHRICHQPKELNKISKTLKEFFIIIDND